MIKLKREEKKKIKEILKDYTKNKAVRSMAKFKQHRGISTFTHCKNVAHMSYWLNHRMRLGADDRSMLVGALLHDFHLYDWRTNGTGGFRHGFLHPKIAADNASRHFNIDKKTRGIIRSHMFPLTLFHVPRSREALIVSVADKIVTVREVLGHAGKKRGRAAGKRKKGKV